MQFREPYIKSWYVVIKSWIKKTWILGVLLTVSICFKPYANLQGCEWEKKLFSLQVWTMRVKCYTKYLLQFYQKQTFWEEENNPKTSNIWDKKNFMVVGHKLNNVINGYNLFFNFHLSYSFNSLLMVSIVSIWLTCHIKQTSI